MWIALAIISSLLIGYAVYRVAQARKPDDEFDDSVEEVEEDPVTYFDYLTVAEQFEKAKETKDNLLMMEKFMSDLSLSSIDSQMIVQLSWTDSDGKSNLYDLYCDGMNTSSECLQKIAQRESAELRNTLAEQCQSLARSTRSEENFGKIPDGARKIFENVVGEESGDDDEALSDVR